MPEFLKKILWATDFSEESQDAFVYAGAFAKTFGAELVAYTGYDDLTEEHFCKKRLVQHRLNRRRAGAVIATRP